MHPGSGPACGGAGPLARPVGDRQQAPAGRLGDGDPADRGRARAAGEREAVAPARPPTRAIRGRGRRQRLRRRHRRVPAGPVGPIGVRARAGPRAPPWRLSGYPLARAAPAPGPDTPAPHRVPVRPVRAPRRRRGQRHGGLWAGRHVADQRGRCAAPARLGLRRRALAGRAEGSWPRRARPLLRTRGADARLAALPRRLAGSGQVGSPGGGRRRRCGDGRAPSDQRHVRGGRQRRRHPSGGLHPVRRLRQRVQSQRQEHCARQLPARRRRPRRRDLLRDAGPYRPPRSRRSGLDRHLRHAR